jgi:hypothetical protein
MTCGFYTEIQRLFPLPKGEGQGEGKHDDQSPNGSPKNLDAFHPRHFQTDPNHPRFIF